MDASDERSHRRALALLVGLLALTHAPLFAGRVVIARDVDFALAPMRRVVHDAVTRGRLPRWNPFVGVGVPVLANPLHAFFQPLSWPAFLTDSPLVASATSWLLVVWGSAGCAQLARAFGSSSAAAVVAGLAWGLAGPTQSEWTAGARLGGQAWIPWLALAAVTAVRGAHADGRPPWRGALGVALALAMSLLHGEPFVSLFGAGFALCLAAVELAALPRDAWTRASLRGLGLASLTAGLAGGLTGALALGPALGGASGTQRAATLADAVATTWSLHPARVLDLAVVGGWSVANAAVGDATTQAVVGRWALLPSYYVGGTVLALALAGLTRARRSVGLAAVAALGLALAMGSHTPLYALARALVPPLAYMRSPEKLLCVVVPAVALLAAAGFDRLVARARGALLGPLVLAAGLASMVVAAPGLPPRVAPFFQVGAVQSLVPLALLVGAVVAAWRWPRAGVAAALVVALDLGHASSLVTPWAELADARHRPALADTLTRAFAARRAPAPVRLWRSDALDDRFGDMVNVPRARRPRETLRANTNVLFGLGQLPGYDVAVSSELDPLLARRRVDVARLLAVDAILQPMPRAGAAPPPGVTLMGAVHGVGVLWAVRDALPRVYAAGGADEVTDVTARRRALDGDVVSGATVLLAERADGVGRGAPGEAGRCRVTRHDNGDLEARCALDRDGWAVVVEQWAPGWRATVDGVATPLRRANLLVMAAPMRRGEHVLRLRYDPPGFARGVMLGALGLALTAALAVLAQTRRGARGDA